MCLMSSSPLLKSATQESNLGAEPSSASPGATINRVAAFSENPRLPNCNIIKETKWHDFLLRLQGQKHTVSTRKWPPLPFCLTPLLTPLLVLPYENSFFSFWLYSRFPSVSIGKTRKFSIPRSPMPHDPSNAPISVNSKVKGYRSPSLS